MAIDTTSNRFFYLRAAMKFGFWSGNTAPIKFYGPINFTKMEITAPKQKMTRLLSNMDGSFGNLLDSQPSVTDPPTLACEFDSMTSGMLSLLIGAQSSALTQSVGAVTNEAITPVLGVWSRFANRFIAADGTGTEIVFNDATPVTPLVVANSHFEFDLVNGMFRPIDSTGITAVTVSYHKAARSGEVYDAGLAVSQYVMLAGTATELASNKRCTLEIHKANIMPNGKIDLVGNAYLKGALDGDILLPSGYTSPWRFEYTDQSAS